MMNAKTLNDVLLVAFRPAAEPNAVQIDAYLGDLYLGQRTYYGTSLNIAKSMARSYIKQHGSLN